MHSIAALFVRRGQSLHRPVVEVRCRGAAYAARTSPFPVGARIARPHISQASTNTGHAMHAPTSTPTLLHRIPYMEKTDNLRHISRGRKRTLLTGAACASRPEGPLHVCAANTSLQKMDGPRRPFFVIFFPFHSAAGCSALRH